MRACSSIIISPISPECQLVPHAVMMMWSIFSSSSLRDVHAAELGVSVLDDETAAHGVLDGLRLLEDLLEHEVVEPALLDLVEIPIDAAHALAHAARAEVAAPGIRRA